MNRIIELAIEHPVITITVALLGYATGLLAGWVLDESAREKS